MLICPACGQENIPGTDVCESCGSPLDFLSKPEPATPVEQRVLTDRIHMLAPREPILVSPSTTVAEVLQTMVDRGVGSIIVVDGDQVVGIFSERDALMRLNTQAAELTERPIADFMTPNPEVLAIDDKIAFALSKMDVGGYRHMPVVDDGTCTGVVSVRDVLRYLSDTILAPLDDEI